MVKQNNYYGMFYSCSIVYPMLTELITVKNRTLNKNKNLRNFNSRRMNDKKLYKVGNNKTNLLELAVSRLESNQYGFL